MMKRVGRAAAESSVQYQDSLSSSSSVLVLLPDKFRSCSSSANIQLQRLKGIYSSSSSSGVGTKVKSSSAAYGGRKERNSTFVSGVPFRSFALFGGGSVTAPSSSSVRRATTDKFCSGSSRDIRRYGDYCDGGGSSSCGGKKQASFEITRGQVHLGQALFLCQFGMPELF